VPPIGQAVPRAQRIRSRLHRTRNDAAALRGIWTASRRRSYPCGAGLRSNQYGVEIKGRIACRQNAYRIGSARECSSKLAVTDPAGRIVKLVHCGDDFTTPQPCSTCSDYGSAIRRRCSSPLKGHVIHSVVLVRQFACGSDVVSGMDSKPGSSRPSPRTYQ